MPELELATDSALLGAWRAGDAAAGRALFGRHFGAVFRFFRNKIADAAEDLTQQTFMACVKGKESFRGDASFRTYLFMVARKRLYTYLRDTNRQPSIHGMGTVSIEDLGFVSPVHAIQLREEQRLLLRALRRLPLDHQVALELFYWEDLGVAEIAEVLEVPAGTVKSRLQRARAKLDAIMAEIADSETLLRSTMDNFEAWARGLQRQLGPQGGTADGDL